MNAKFEHLYRDSGNNKKWGEVTFTNCENKNLRTLDSQIREILIDHEFFIAQKYILPELSFQAQIKSSTTIGMNIHHLTIRLIK